MARIGAEEAFFGKGKVSRQWRSIEDLESHLPKDKLKDKLKVKP